jgi:ribonuclease J
VEGTRVDVDRPITEPEVHQAADEVVAREPGLVIADFTARNIERLRTFRDIAKVRGRRLVVTTKDAYLLERLHVIDPNIPAPEEDGIAVLKEPMGTVQLWEREVLNRFAGNLVDASVIRKEPGAHILCLSYWDIGNLVDLDPQGGTYLYSSSEAYSEDQRIDQQRLENWLDRFHLRKVGGLPNAESGPFHASGHIGGPALQELIDRIAPERILPVHTERLDWFQARWGAKVVVTQYGEEIRGG